MKTEAPRGRTERAVIAAALEVQQRVSETIFLRVDLCTRGVATTTLSEASLPEKLQQSTTINIYTSYKGSQIHNPMG